MIAVTLRQTTANPSRVETVWLGSQLQTVLNRKSRDSRALARMQWWSIRLGNTLLFLQSVSVYTSLYCVCIVSVGDHCEIECSELGLCGLVYFPL